MVCEAPAPPPFAARSPEKPREIAQLELIFVLDPRVIERAKRLEFAIHRLQQGMSPFDVRLALRLQFRVPQQTAWRIVDMALDLAGPI
jgi:hypothetical protein